MQHTGNHMKVDGSKDGTRKKGVGAFQVTADHQCNGKEDSRHVEGAGSCGLGARHEAEEGATERAEVSQWSGFS